MLRSIIVLLMLAGCAQQGGPDIDKSPAMQAERQQFVQKLIDQGLVQKIEERGTNPRMWVRPAFRMLDYTTKQKFVSVVFALYCTGKNTGETVTLVDSLSGEEIGDYSVAYGGLKLK